MARPDICVITNIGQCHLENLHDRAGIFKAKTEIFDYMQEDGQICLNGEDDLLAMVSVVNGSPVHHFGISDREDLEVYATDIENEGLFGSRAQMHFAGACADPQTGNEGVPITIKLPGQHMVINAMAAAMVGRLLHMTAEQIAEGIACVEPVNGRSHLMKVKDMVVIDDCYNANPVSTKAAVVSHIEYRPVVGNVFTPLYDQLCAGKERHAAERPVDDGEGTAAFDIHIEFADDPLRQHERHGKDQKQHDKGCGNQKTNHGKSPLYYLKLLSHYTKALRRAQGLAEYDRFIQIFGLDDDVGVGGGGSGAVLGSRP